MNREKLIFCGTSDLAGHFRGKAFPAADRDARAVSGVGMPPTNIMLSAFGPIHTTPFGTAGDVALIPDFSTLVDVEFSDTASECFVIGDLREDGGVPWACCPRDFARRAIEGLRHEADVVVRAAFEQEFYCPDLPTPGSFRLESIRRSGLLGEVLLGAMRAAGVTPDSFVAEYAPGQFEVTVAPALGLRAADEAVITREMIRASAARLGQRATLAPILSPESVGSGTHVHLSLERPDGTPMMVDAAAPDELSPLGRHFVAGVAAHLPAICALTAPSAASYYRLKPNKWAPIAANVAMRDRGAALRLCTSHSTDPETRAKKFNLEFRVADACASPYMALGAVLHSGLAGVRDKLPMPDTASAAPLPATLEAALEPFAASEAARAWLGPVLHDAYLMLKHAELASLAGCSEAQICARYAAAY